MIETLNKDYCTGCGACAQACPKNCIIMEKNEEGFLFPQVDQTECVWCGLCAKSCPQISGSIRYGKHRAAYAAYAKDDDLLKKSTSGGVFAAAAKKILHNGGLVFGTEMGTDFRARVIHIEKEEDLPRLQGSKYVQADVGNAYKQAEKFLKEGHTVLFGGVPCQIAGLQGYLKKDYDNLFTMDLICHGVPSPELFASYVSYMEKKHGQKILRWSFRDKEVDGWRICDKVIFENKILKQRELLDPYTHAFLANELFRESCYNCFYAQKERLGDFTIGDFWGIEGQHPEVPTDQGVSLLLINTKKGEKLLEMIREEMVLIESDYDKMAEGNGNLKKPSPRPAKRDTIYRNFAAKSMRQFVREDLAFKPDKAEILRQYIPGGVRKGIKNIGRFFFGENNS